MRLENSLVLNKYFLSLFNMANFEEVQDLLKKAQEGENENGNSYFFEQLKKIEEMNQEVSESLMDFEANIKNYLKKLNSNHRVPKIRLKYYQYFSVLVTEIFLKKYFESPNDFLRELNEFASNIPGNEDIFFSRKDLTKLAYWMATGCGKTFIMHINYFQILHYNRGPNQIQFDNIILITPSENLSEQHLEEFKRSSIPADLLINDRKNYFSSFVGNKMKVKVIEITKLIEEKTGEGLRVPVHQIGQKNLLFVDEGHKGSGGIQWRKLRYYLAQEGFCFEYSATFGQAIVAAGRSNAENPEALIIEYAKAIICDYSYKYFYSDGYGKEYLIINISAQKFSEDQKFTLFLANLLTFYQQIIYYKENPEIILKYNIEKPLWIFIGSKVSGKTIQSDIKQIIYFLALFLENDDNWVINSIKNVLTGFSGLTKDGVDVFSEEFPEKFNLLKEKIKNNEYGNDPEVYETIYYDILKKVFYSSESGCLNVIPLRKARGEIALRCDINEFFGVINIGDVSNFIKVFKDEKSTEEIKKHVILDKEGNVLLKSFFKSINQKNSKINLLIGAKKFIEGWNSWRVSSMGLLNIGKNEGALIIQLFGRGVRLHGKDDCLKRSEFIESNPPLNLKINETLNIFGLEANYMENFKTYLEVEGLVNDFDKRKLPIRIKEEVLKEPLYDLHIDVTKFKKTKFFKLDQKFGDLKVVLSLLPKVDLLTSKKPNNKSTPPISPKLINPSVLSSRIIPKKYLDLLDWDSLFLELKDFQIERDWTNFIFTISDLKEIIEDKNTYDLKCEALFLEVFRFEDVIRIQEIVYLLLKKYLIEYYRRVKNIWKRERTELKQLTMEDGNFDFTYEFRIMKMNNETIRQKRIIQTIYEELETFYDDNSIYGEFDSQNFRNINCKVHLYQPLLEIKTSKELLGVYPAPLNVGEIKFIDDLNLYLKKNPEIFEKNKIYLLRNLPKKGTGIFEETQTFYPDFIMWIITQNQQIIIFIDPKGLAHMFEGLDEEKLKLNDYLKKIELKLNNSKGIPPHKFLLHSYIVSTSTHHSVRKLFNYKTITELADYKILFQKDDSKYIKKLFSQVL